MTSDYLDRNGEEPRDVAKLVHAERLRRSQAGTVSTESPSTTGNAPAMLARTAPKMVPSPGSSPTPKSSEGAPVQRIVYLPLLLGVTVKVAFHWFTVRLPS